MAKIVTATIDEKGDVVIETAGYQGKGCDAIQKVIGDALGTTMKSVKKPEYNKPLKGNTCVKQ